MSGILRIGGSAVGVWLMVCVGARFGGGVEVDLNVNKVSNCA